MVCGIEIVKEKDRNLTCGGYVLEISLKIIAVPLFVGNVFANPIPR